MLFTLVFLGLLVMATDVGRMYLIQGELQTAADAAALAAATQLVGTANASLHAGDQVTASFDSTTGNDNRFNLRQNQIGISAGLVAARRGELFLHAARMRRPISTADKSAELTGAAASIRNT